MTETNLTIDLPVRARRTRRAPRHRRRAALPRRDPVAEYLTLDEALPRGLRITENDAGGSVPELLVANPLDGRVLLYDGEELVGAKQNRILNVSVLVEARVDAADPGLLRRAGTLERTRRLLRLRPRTSRTRSCGAARRRRWPLGRSSAAPRRAWSGTRCGRSLDACALHSPTGAQLGRLRRTSALDSTRSSRRSRCSPARRRRARARRHALPRLVSRPEAFEQLWPKLRRRLPARRARAARRRAGAVRSSCPGSSRRIAEAEHRTARRPGSARTCASAASASSARVSSSTASCCSSRPSRATTADGRSAGSRGPAGGDSSTRGTLLDTTRRTEADRHGGEDPEGAKDGGVMTKPNAELKRGYFLLNTDGGNLRRRPADPLTKRRSVCSCERGASSP